MNIQQQIDEIIDFLKEDCSYYAIVGTIFKTDITENFRHQKLDNDEFSFNHIYFTQIGSPSMDDYYTGQTLIPIGNDVYALCEWSS